MGSRAAKHVKPQGGSAPKATPGSPGCRNPTDGWGLPGRKVRAHRNVPYHELGGDYFTRRDPERAASRAMTRLNKLGCRVTLDLKEATVPAGTKPGGHGPVWRAVLPETAPTCSYLRVRVAQCALPTVGNYQVSGEAPNGSAERVRRGRSVE